KKRFISSLDTPQDIEKAERWIKNFTREKIPREMLEISFARSSGPGGQNVNKLNTKVDIRINLDKAYWIPEYARNKIKIQESNHINKKGELVLVSQLTRTQSRNIEDCIDKFVMYRSLLKLNYDDAETQKKKVIEIMISKSENLH
ncbi:2608_t:CDS:2, partial [Entrophospora sp. SA101]